MKNLDNFNKFIYIVSSISKYLSAFGLLVIAITMLTQVILRFFFKSCLLWAEELSRYGIIWIVMLTSGILVKEDELIKVDFFDKFWPENIRKYRDLIYQFLILIILAVILIEGWGQAISGLKQRTTSLGIKWFWPYISIPIGAILMIFYYVVSIINKIRLIKREKLI